MADKLREYLIALGFNVDPRSYKKFKDAIATSSKDVATLGSVTASAATAIALSVEKVAREYEGLFYLSQRTRTSVNDLKSYSFAAKQIGIDFGQSQAAIESFTTAMRLNPGIKGFVGIGGGTGRDAVEQLTNFVEHQKRLYGEAGYYVAAMNAELAGIPEATFLQIWNNLPKLRAAQAEMNRMRREAGLAGRELTDQGVAFANAWDHLEASLGIGRERLTLDLIRPVGLGVKALDDLIQTFSRVDVATAGWVGTVTALGAAIGGTSAALALLLRMLGVRGFLGASLGASSRILLPLASAAWLVGLGQEASETPEGKNFHASGNLVQDIYGWLRAVKPTLQKRLGITPEGGAGDGRAGIIDYFEKQGWSHAAAVGIAANLFQESGFNPNATGDNGQAYGLAQWHKDRQEAFRQWSGKDIRSATRDEQLAFVQYELTQGADAQARRAGEKLRGTTDPYDAGVIFSGLYERPADVYGEAHRRGNLAASWFDTPLAPGAGGNTTVTINQTTNIPVTSSDPAAAGNSVAAAQNRVNGDMVRNFQGMTR